MWILLVLFGILTFFAFIKAVIGPGIADRLIVINLIGSIVIIMLAILSVILKEDYLLDISIIYAMISFLAIVVLSKIYTGIYLREKSDKEEKEKKDGEQ